MCFYKYFVDNVDYMLTNVIGPKIDNIHLKITDSHFITTAKSKEIIFNIISSGDKMNITCSFKKGIVKNKKRFERCIYKAYKQLIHDVE
jgi:hypothetical protein